MKLKIYFLLFLCISKSLILSEEQTEGIDNSNFAADPLGDSGSFKVIEILLELLAIDLVLIHYSVLQI